MSGPLILFRRQKCLTLSLNRSRAKAGLHCTRWLCLPGSLVFALLSECICTSDPEEMQAHLAPEDLRDDFYTYLTDFAKSLRLAFSTAAFWRDADEDLISKYKKDLKMFLNLKGAVQQRFQCSHQNLSLKAPRSSFDFPFSFLADRRAISDQRL